MPPTGNDEQSGDSADRCHRLTEPREHHHHQQLSSSHHARWTGWRSTAELRLPPARAGGHPRRHRPRKRHRPPPGIITDVTAERQRLCEQLQFADFDIVSTISAEPPPPGEMFADASTRQAGTIFKFGSWSLVPTRRTAISEAASAIRQRGTSGPRAPGTDRRRRRERKFRGRQP